MSKFKVVLGGGSGLTKGKILKSGFEGLLRKTGQTTVGNPSHNLEILAQNSRNHICPNREKKCK